MQWNKKSPHKCPFHSVAAFRPSLTFSICLCPDQPRPHDCTPTPMYKKTQSFPVLYFFFSLHSFSSQPCVAGCKICAAAPEDKLTNVHLNGSALQRQRLTGSPFCNKNWIVLVGLFLPASHRLGVELWFYPRDMNHIFLYTADKSTSASGWQK